jgi:hypothetical protein
MLANIVKRSGTLSATKSRAAVTTDLETTSIDDSLVINLSDRLTSGQSQQYSHASSERAPLLGNSHGGQYASVEGRVRSISK